MSRIRQLATRLSCVARGAEEEEEEEERREADRFLLLSGKVNVTSMLVLTMTVATVAGFVVMMVITAAGLAVEARRVQRQPRGSSLQRLRLRRQARPVPLIVLVAVSVSSRQ